MREEPHTGPLHCTLACCLLDSPHSDIEDVGAHGAGHGHVTEAFSRYNHTGDQVGD